MFTFTENDLPPGPLAKRLLAAKVSVALTHAAPDAPSPPPPQTHAVDWEGMELSDGGERDTTAASSALALIGPVEHSVTPETDPEEASDESGYDHAIASHHSSSTGERDSDALAVNGGGRGAYKSPERRAARDSSDDDEDDGRFYLTSDDDSTRGTPARRNESLHVVGGLDPLRVLSSTSPWNVQVTPGNLASGSGFTTPMSSKCPSPLRSCPRSAISSKRERLNERTDVLKESTSTSTSTSTAARAPPGLPRWASSKTFGATPARKEEGLSPRDTMGASEKQQERRPRPANPLGSLEGNALALPAPPCADGAAGGHGAGHVNGVRLSRKPWAAAAEAPDATDADGPAVRLDKLALQGHAEGKESSPRGSDEGEQASKAIEVNVTSKHSTTSSGFKKPSPAVRHLLDAAAARSFEDLQSSKHTSACGSDTDESESGGDVGMDMDSFSGGDEGEDTSSPAHALASGADFGTFPTPAEPASWSPVPPGETENRLTVATDTSASSAETALSEDLEAIQPLKQRVWPPPRGVVAGVEEVQGALESPNGSEGPQQQVGRHTRRHGSTGMAWGEDAKLALARKRLQWEK